MRKRNRVRRIGITKESGIIKTTTTITTRAKTIPHLLKISQTQSRSSLLARLIRNRKGCTWETYQSVTSATFTIMVHAKKPGAKTVDV